MMICTSFIIFSLSLINDITAIPCDFIFLENDPQYPEKIFDKIDFIKYGSTTSTPYFYSFECEERDDHFEEEKFSSSNKSNIQSTKQDQQYIFTSPDEDDYEDVESTCQVSRRTIQPKALNNIYNKLTKVVNTASFIQSINLEQCLSKTEQCNSAMSTPKGKKHICRQKHVRITLKALKDNEEGNAIIDEQFYYPSHCVCELVTVKKRKRLAKTKCRPIKQSLKSL